MAPPWAWEFPGGKVEPYETDAACIVREMQEELGLVVEILESGPSVLHPLGDGRVLELLPFVCIRVAGEMQLREHAEARWCLPEEMAQLDWAAADLGILAWWREVSWKFIS